MNGSSRPDVCLMSKPSSGLPWWLRIARILLQCRRLGFDLWVGKVPWRRAWLSTPVFLSGEFHGQRSLVGYSPWGCKESDTTERLILQEVSYILSRGQPPPPAKKKKKPRSFCGFRLILPDLTPSTFSGLCSLVIPLLRGPCAVFNYMNRA